jgi:hypothetical protein
MTTDDLREVLLNIGIMYDALADRAAGREARADRRSSGSSGPSKTPQL